MTDASIILLIYTLFAPTTNINPTTLICECNRLVASAYTDQISMRHINSMRANSVCVS